MLETTNEEIGVSFQRYTVCPLKGIQVTKEHFNKLVAFSKSVRMTMRDLQEQTRFSLCWVVCFMSEA